MLEVIYKIEEWWKLSQTYRLLNFQVRKSGYSLYFKQLIICMRLLLIFFFLITEWPCSQTPPGQAKCPILGGHSPVVAQLTMCTLGFKCASCFYSFTFAFLEQPPNWTRVKGLANFVPWRAQTLGLSWNGVNLSLHCCTLDTFYQVKTGTGLPASQNGT